MEAQFSDFKTSNKTDNLPPVYSNIIEDTVLLLSASCNFKFFSILYKHFFFLIHLKLLQSVEIP